MMIIMSPKVKEPQPGQAQARAGYDAPCFFEAEGHALSVVSRFVVDLPDAGQEEDLVVHGEAEEDCEERMGRVASRKPVEVKLRRPSRLPCWKMKTRAP